MTDLLWQIPLYGLAGAMAWRLLIVPYELWAEAESRSDGSKSAIDAVRHAAEVEQARQDVIDRAERRREFRKNTGLFAGGLGSAFEKFEKDSAAADEAERQLKSELSAKAKAMRARLRSRHHTFGTGDEADNNYLAALWDAESRGETYDEYHARTLETEAEKQQRYATALAESRKPKLDMPIREVLKYLAFESQWAEGYDASEALEAYRPHSTTEYKWTHDLSSEFLHAAPEIKSRGIHQQFEKKPDNGRSDIPDSFWQRADLDVIDMLCTDFASIAFIGGEQVYRDIVFDKQEIEARWPPRPKSRKWTAFKKLARPWKENADKRAGFNENAWGNIA